VYHLILALGCGLLSVTSDAICVARVIKLQTAEAGNANTDQKTLFKDK
jgi:hypothetical protein